MWDTMFHRKKFMKYPTKPEETIPCLLSWLHDCASLIQHRIEAGNTTMEISDVMSIIEVGTEIIEKGTND